jgi:hypothetical protein
MALSTLVVLLYRLYVYSAKIAGMTVIAFGDGKLVELSEQEHYEYPHPLQQWAMPLVAFQYDNEEVIAAQPLGTAFAIGPHLLVTAKHVLDPLRTDDISSGGTIALRDDMWPRAMFTLVQSVPGQNYKQGALLPMQAISLSPSHDLAVMTTMTFDSNDWQPTFSCAPLTIRPPVIGSTVLALGYAGLQASVTGSSENGDTELEVNQPVVASRGRIQEHYVPQRDSVMINFPAMQGDFPSLSGMSGGPVITEDGRVCGMVCSSVDSEDGETWTSTCALLAPLFALSVKGNLAGTRGRWSIRDLAEHGIVPTDGSHTKVHFEQDGEDILFAWSADDGDG